MGNKSQNPTQIPQNNQIYQSLIPLSLTKPNSTPQFLTTSMEQKQKQICPYPYPYKTNNQQYCRIFLDQFNCIAINQGQNVYSEYEITFHEKNIVITKYYQCMNELQKYLSNIIKISKIMRLVLYDQLKFYPNHEKCSTVLTIEVKGYKLLTCELIKGWTISKKLDLLQFVTSFLSKIVNIYICPDYIVESSSNASFYLLNFSVTQNYTSQQIFLAFLRWLFSEQISFQICLASQSFPQNMPIYLQQIYSHLSITKKLKIKQLNTQLKMIQNKMQLLQNKTDSFYACSYFNKIHKYTSKSDWIFLQIKHQVYFYHINDMHPFVGKIIRKKKKKQIQDCCLTFDPQQLQLLWVPQNSKYIVKSCQFQFQSSSSVSDIQIKYKLPLKLKNCLIHRCRNGDILLLQQNLYRYHPTSNKLIQQTKRICDYIFITSTRDYTAFIIKSSIDILKNGIRVFYKNQDYILAHAGDKIILEQISSVRIDIRHVVFCLEVYKGVFIMMASRNLWILDLNFQCYFSYAPPNRISKLSTNLSSTSATTNSFSTVHSTDYLFQILNQPFKVQFPLQATGNNIAIKDNYLHIIGTIQRHPYYLKYSFIHRIGAIKLQGYHPLFVQSQFTKIGIKQQEIIKRNFNKDKTNDNNNKINDNEDRINQNISQDEQQQNQDEEYSDRQKYCFNFHEQNSQIYKYGNWIFKGQLLVKVYDFKIKFQKTNYQVHLQIQKIQKTLKKHLQSLTTSSNQNQNQINQNIPSIQTRPKLQIILLLYRIYKIYEYLFKNSITHRNISINHLVFTQNKQLKLHGWSQPPRNWHVNDYKDYLLVCFNIITGCTYQKISDKITQKYEQQLQKYQTLSQKIHSAFKQNKNIQKHTQIQKNLISIKSYLQKQLSNILQSYNSSTYIFAPQFNTPRLSILNIITNKLTKLTIIPQQNVLEQFIFNQTDKYIWNQELKRLYIFTIAHQFYQIKVEDTTTDNNNNNNTNSNSNNNSNTNNNTNNNINNNAHNHNINGIIQKKICLQDYQYLPINIASAAFVCIKNNGLYSFGGIKKQADGRSVYNYKIFKFNWKILAWDIIGQIPQPRIDPHVVPSICNRYIYIFGKKSIQNPFLSLIKFDTITNTCTLLQSPTIPNIAFHQNNYSPMRIFHISQLLSIFMYFSIQDNNYVIRYISYSTIGFNIQLKIKNYSIDNILASQSISYQGNTVHVLRMYGKYTKIIVNKLDSLAVKNQTIYAI